MTFQRIFLPFTAILLISLLGIHTSNILPHYSIFNDIGEDLDRNKYGQNPLTSDAEFAYFENLRDKFGFKRSLQTSMTTTTYCNTWCQLKESLGLTIVGLVLICISPCLIWLNEERHVKELRRIDFCKNKAVVIENSDISSDAFTGELVHFVGNVSVDDNVLELKPGALNITSPLPNALTVKRTCMIYQKFEMAKQQTQQDTFGAGETTTTTYRLYEEWTDMGPQERQLEHMPYETNSRGIWDKLTLDKDPNDMTISEAAHVGGFGLSKYIIKENPSVFQCEWLPLPAEFVPEEIESLPELHKNSEGELTTVVDNQPTNGDVIVKYEYATDGFDASFIVKQVLNYDSESGIKFGVEKGRVIDEKCCGSDDLGFIWMVRRGRYDLAEMIKMAQDDESMTTKLFRVICWILLVAGWSMIFSILTTLMSTLPILGTLGNIAFFIVALIIGTVCCCGVTAFAYIRYRPLLAISIIVISCSIVTIFSARVSPTEVAATMR